MGGDLPYDGMLAILPMIIGRVEHPSPSTVLLWENQGPSESLSYRCADGQYIQLWFGAKGAYEEFLDHMGDGAKRGRIHRRSVGGAMAERNVRWTEQFASGTLVVAPGPVGEGLPLRAGVAGRGRRSWTITSGRWV